MTNCESLRTTSSAASRISTPSSRFTATLSVYLAILFPSFDSDPFHPTADNLLVSLSGRVLLTDFGVAVELRSASDTNNAFVGTPLYMAPEMLVHTAHSFVLDIWSFGITLLDLATGKAPMADLHPTRVMFLIPANPPPKLEGNYDPLLKDLIAHCLVKDPAARPTALELLAHPYVAGVSDGDHEALAKLVRHGEEVRAAAAAAGDGVGHIEETPPMSPHHEWWKYDVGSTPELLAKGTALVLCCCRAFSCRTHMTNPK